VRCVCSFVTSSDPASGAADTVASLRFRLARLEREAAARQRRLDRYAADLRELFKQERERSQELRRFYRATVLALVNAVEARDAYTHRHAQRVAAYGLRIAQAGGVGVDPQVEFGFLLHDVGKVAVPDAILFKPGPLTERERALVRKHPEVGSEILRHIDFLGDAKAVVRHHHERWDGGGYPDGLTGAAIPVHARVFAVADTLDALTSERPYRPAVSCAEARDVIRAQSGTQFDPAVVAAYESVPDEDFARIREAIV
jgi:putative nucleotidyltransferase with HDIG domain